MGSRRNTQWRRRAEIERIRAEARRYAAAHLADARWAAGTALYWAEGAKTNRLLAITNSDPRLLRAFVRWVRDHHDPGARFVLMLHLHEGNDEPAARRWWVRTLGLPNVEFHKTYVKPAGTGHRKNTLPNGVCRVMMRRGTDAWIRTMEWIDVLADHLEQQRQLATLPGGSLAQLARATDS